MNIGESAQRDVGHGEADWLRRARVGLARLGAAWAARRQRAWELYTLTQFSDRQLMDIGLGRPDVSNVVNGTFHRG
jgi:uncharacterized protein YjiS (DUF1127 family)